MSIPNHVKDPFYGLTPETFCKRLLGRGATVSRDTQNARADHARATYDTLFETAELHVDKRYVTKTRAETNDAPRTVLIVAGASGCGLKGDVVEAATALVESLEETIGRAQRGLALARRIKRNAIKIAAAAPKEA